MSTSVLHQPIDVDGMLQLHDRRVALIRQAANEAREVDYHSRWRDVLARCAAWFSSVPYSPTQYREPGGAFRCTVETAFYAMRLAGGQKFGTNLPSEKRRLIEPQYNHAVFLAAVCSGLDEPHRHFVVVRDSDRAEWNPAGHGALATWLAGATYQLRRRATPLPVERMRTALLAQSLIGQTLLAGYDTGVLSELFGAINPLSHVQGTESLVHKVVRQAVAVAADFDRKAQQGVYDPVPYPVPSAMHVAAAVQPVVTPAPAAPPPTSPASPVASASPAVSAAPVVPVAPTPSAAAPAPHVQMPAGQATTPSAGGSPSANAAEASTSSPPLDITVPTAGPSTDAALNPDVKAGSAADPQLGLPFSGEPVRAPAAVDPAAMRAPAARVDRPAPPASFDAVLEGQPNMIREFFKALREDVSAGKAKVAWTDKGLALPKRLLGSYGVASDTLVEHLRRRSLLVSNVQAEIVLAPRAGELIMERPEA
ncbi:MULTISPECIES: TraI domain-containing protein [unclassified Paraburkholderia]|uniref:TraI domain-containing protein n=1 Tax=unclassified Paraburkholderia TaxID=2615204 RepID=UPI002AB31503|nr:MULTISPECIES: TraI domain-containing protein [unclassified Paraburkholderia]